MNDSLEDAPRRRTPWIIGGIVIGGLLLLMIPTCRNSSVTSNAPNTEDPSTQDNTKEQCRRTLESALDGLRPNRLGLSSESRVMVDTLNNWLTQCPATDVAAVHDDDLTLRGRLLSENALEFTNQTRFQDRDAAHIRNSLLAKSIVDVVTKEKTNDRDRAVELFYYVIRTIELVPDEAMDVPLTPYESLLFGGGTAADRAWTFAILLRQLRLDCVIMQPIIEAGQTPYWLVGVVTPAEGILLFDPRLGLPISVAEDGTTPLPRLPAALSQVLDDDGLLRQFDRPGVRYPLTSEDLKSIDVFAIGTSSTWSPRMEQLQTELSEPVELYDGLTANRLRETGLYERVVKAGSDGRWTEEQVGLWPYPESHWADAPTLTNRQQQVLDSRMGILDGPYDIKIKETDAGHEYVAVQSQRTLHQARIEQLMGNYATAQQVFLSCRLKFQDFQKIDLPEVRINYLASEMATFWGAQCQYDQGDHQAALNSAKLYLKRPNGQFFLSAIYLGSLSLANLDQQAEAALLLSQDPPQAPQFLGNQSLVARWRQQSKSEEPAVDKLPPDNSDGESSSSSPTDNGKAREPSGDTPGTP